MQPVDGQWDAPMQSTFSTPMHPPSHFHLEGVQQSTDRCSLYFVFIITFLRFSFKSIFFIYIRLACTRMRQIQFGHIFFLFWYSENLDTIFGFFLSILPNFLL